MDFLATTWIGQLLAEFNNLAVEFLPLPHLAELMVLLYVTILISGPPSPSKPPPLAVTVAERATVN
uniref:Uncharacterized protein n=1 Tax=Leersia perrieri TaxID=77586 RepID=A0A0D9WGU8_9ORYZ